MKRILKFIPILLVLVLIGIFYPQQKKAETIDLAHFNIQEPGRFLLLFSAGWCKQCEEQLPEIQKLKQRLNIPLYAVSTFDETYYLQHKNLIDKMVHDPANELSAILGIHTIPNLFLIDQTGKILVEVRKPLDEESIARITKQ